MDATTGAGTFVTPYAAAKTLNVSPKTIYKLVAGGELEAIKVGRAVRIYATSLQEFIARNTIRRADPAPPAASAPPGPPKPRRVSGAAAMKFTFFPPP